MPRRAVFIMTDSQRWDMVNCYRQTGLSTPNLDRLAASGVRFERAYTTSPICGPARAGLFTGQWPHANGGWANHLPLGAGVRTLGQRLTAAGVHAAYIGKWHLDGFDYFGRGQCPDGWDPAAWYDMRNYLDELAPADRPRSRDMQTIWEGDGIPAEFTYGHRCATRATTFLQQHRDEDFLLVVSFDEPHGPYICPKSYAARYADYDFPLSPNVADTLADKPEHIRLWAGHRARKPPVTSIRRPEYFGANTFVDEQIGRVLDAIEAHCPDALVIYTSDHGHMEQSHRLYIKGPAMYDEIARIPFLVRHPGRTPAGAVCPYPVSHIDVTPTLLDFFGVPDPGTLHGASLLAGLADPAQANRGTVFCEFGRGEVDCDGGGAFQPIRCALDGRYKLVVNLMTTDELYDMTADPYEMHNCIDDPALATIRNALHDRLLDWMNNTADPFRGWYWERRPWRIDAPPVADWHYTGGIRQRRTEADEPALLDYDTGLPPKSLTRYIPQVAENK